MLNLPDNHGALVGYVEPGSPADQAGLKSGDVIVKLADHEVADPPGFRNLTAGLDVGAQVPMTFYRDGKPKSVDGDDRRAPPGAGSAVVVRLPRSGPTRGGRGRDLRRDQPGRQRQRRVSGGLASRMRILKVGEEPVKSLAEFEVAVRRNDFSQGLPLLIQSTDGRVVTDSPGHRQGSQPALMASPDLDSSIRLPRLTSQSGPDAIV